MAGQLVADVVAGSGEPVGGRRLLVTGGVFGVAVLGALLAAGGSGSGGGQALTRGLHAALISAAAVAVAGAVLTAVFIPGRSPAGGPPPR